MCTVSYFPKGENHFILTSNRDEAPKRSATGISIEMRKGKELIFPRDPLANGTWIAASNTNQLVCVLNGAFEKHKHRPPYRLSRGIMALDFFAYDDADHFFEHFEFEGIEPFTMVIFDNGKLYETRWDEQLLYAQPLRSDVPHIWASSTLYPKEWQAKRRKWYANEIENKTMVEQQDLIDFHHTAGEGNPEYDLIMNRHNMVCTTSITSINKQANQIDMRFEDLQNSKLVSKSITINSKISI